MVLLPDHLVPACGRVTDGKGGSIRVEDDNLVIGVPNRLDCTIMPTRTVGDTTSQKYGATPNCPWSKVVRRFEVLRARGMVHRPTSSQSKIVIDLLV
jgi:hypothetical protein